MPIPFDWEHPGWTLDSKIPHHWHNYTSVKLRLSWESFDEEQKQIIASCLEEVAEREDWA